MTSGERRFAQRLMSHLEDDYLCWYEMAVGKKRRYSDFIILHPLRGILLIEVKDWKLESIQSGDRLSFRILTSKGPKSLTNPVEQARQCAHALVSQLQSDPLLVEEKGQYQGKLICPWGYGVVFSNIFRNQYQSYDFSDVIPEHMVICRDEMTESVEVEEFQERLWQMFNRSFPCQLTVPQRDRIRWHIFPEIRIIQPSLFENTFNFKQNNEFSLEETLKVFDLTQEQVARNLGEGHRIIHGVSGSGKTLILGYRAEKLAQVSTKPILILCYNIVLAAKLNAIMREKEIHHKVNVHHFHDWCAEQLKTYNIPFPVDKEGTYFEMLVESVIQSVDKKQIPRGQYEAVMIDEGHDFHAEWLKLITQMVDPKTESLLLLYDDAQSIYKSKHTLNFSLSSVGIKARGRTTILSINYRNTKEILDLAYKFSRNFIEPHVSGEDGVPIISPETPEFEARKGAYPVLIRKKNWDEEAEYLCISLKALKAKYKLEWRDICVIYPRNDIGNVVKKHMIKNQLPHSHLVDKKNKKNYDPTQNCINLMTIHSSKGLEFRLVAIPGIGDMPNKKVDIDSEAKLLYVAMTRSLDMLLLTHSKDSPFTKILYSRIQEQIQKERKE